MIERTPLLNLATYTVMVLGALMVFVPLWLVYVGATLTVREINTPELHFLTGSHLIENLQAAWANPVCPRTDRMRSPRMGSRN